MLKKFIEANLGPNSFNNKDRKEAITDNCLIITNTNSKQKMKFG